MATKLIIGADRGIAHAMSRHLHQRGDSVVAACFGDGSDLAELGIHVEPGVDVTSDEAVTGLAKRLEQQGTRLEWLVNVAGIMRLDTLDTVDYDDARKQFEVNALGPLRVVAGTARPARRGRQGRHPDQPGRVARRQHQRRRLRLPYLQGRGQHGRAQPAP